MVFLIFLLALAIAVGILALNAWLLTIAVPALIADPSNWGAWVVILIVLGFAGSIRKEWRCRLARGESTRNLEAFRQLQGD